jgi:hypothetical protein
MRATATALAVLPVLLLGACGRRPADERPQTLTPRVEDMSRGPVTLTVTVDPPQVFMERDTLVTIRVAGPSEIVVDLPPLDDRVAGFTIAGSFDSGPFEEDGRTVLERNIRLTPSVAEEYRIAPFAVTYRDTGQNPAREEWFPTRPIVLEAVPPFDGNPGGAVRVDLEPAWVYPPPRAILLYAFGLCLLAAAGFLAWKLARHLHRRVRLMRMSPRERAMEELKELMRKDLVARHLVKAFYLELTMIVRRYIERAHSVRAPEQTTEEFLAAVSHDPRFAGRVVARLKAFLEAADLVKFAAHKPSAAAIDEATRTARDYIETDAVAGEQVAAAGTGEG